jgi:hypothetical protein
MAEMAVTETWDQLARPAEIVVSMAVAERGVEAK